MGHEPEPLRAAAALLAHFQTLDALLEAIAGASHHVHVEYYIFEPDHTGTAIRDALAS